MSLYDKFLALTCEQRKSVHLLLCAHALNVWNTYARDQGTVTYGDSVVGMLHEVDRQLPLDALDALREGTGFDEISKRYREPIVAMQDDDLEFPETVEYAYYAIYNCFRKYGFHDEIDDWLITNQAMASIRDSEKQRELLFAAIQTAEGS